MITSKDSFIPIKISKLMGEHLIDKESGLFDVLPDRCALEKKHKENKDEGNIICYKKTISDDNYSYYGYVSKNFLFKDDKSKYLETYKEIKVAGYSNPDESLYQKLEEVYNNIGDSFKKFSECFDIEYPSIDCVNYKFRENGFDIILEEVGVTDFIAMARGRYFGNEFDIDNASMQIQFGSRFSSLSRKTLAKYEFLLWHIRYYQVTEGEFSALKKFQSVHCRDDRMLYFSPLCLSYILNNSTDKNKTFEELFKQYLKLCSK